MKEYRLEKDGIIIRICKIEGFTSTVYVTIPLKEFDEMVKEIGWKVEKGGKSMWVNGDDIAIFRNGDE